MALHRVGVELAHVGPCVLQRGRGDVEVVPLPPPLVGDGDARVVGDDVVADGLDGLRVSLHPAHLENNEKKKTYK